jgi:hypothetical protein
MKMAGEPQLHLPSIYYLFARLSGHTAMCVVSVQAVPKAELTAVWKDETEYRAWVDIVCFSFGRSKVHTQAQRPAILALFRCFPQSLQASAEAAPQISQLPLPFASLTVHYSLQSGRDLMIFLSALSCGRLETALADSDFSAFCLWTPLADDHVLGGHCASCVVHVRALYDFSPIWISDDWRRNEDLTTVLHSSARDEGCYVTHKCGQGPLILGSSLIILCRPRASRNYEQFLKINDNHKYT